MTDAPDVSFVVPSYRSQATIGATLDALAAQRTSLSFEILVVDSSGDGSVRWIGKAHPQVRLIASQNRLLPGAARNLGAGRARGEFLAFVDADAAPEPDWLEAMRAALARGASLAGGWVANANPDAWPSRILHWIEFSAALPGTRGGARPALSSSNWLIARRDFMATGGFSEEAAMSEDLMFCHGFTGTVFFEAASGVRHRHRDTWSQVGPHLEKLGQWSGLYRRRTGSRLARAPWLSYPAAFWRAGMILGRTFRAGIGEGFRCALHLPLVGLGLLRWAGGLRKGLMGEVPSG